MVAQPQLAAGGGVCREDRRAGGPVKFDDAGTQRATSNEVTVAGSRGAKSHRTPECRHAWIEVLEVGTLGMQEWAEERTRRAVWSKRAAAGPSTE